MNILKVLVFFLLIPGYSYAGWVIVEDSRDSYGNSLIQTTFIQDNMIRFETPSTIAIIDLNNKIITMIFSQYRVYWSGTTNDLRMNTLAIFDSELEQILIGLPEYKRKEIDSIYSSIKQQILDSTNYTTDERIMVIETDVVDTLLGYNVVMYNILKDSTIRESFWYTTEVQPYNDIDIGDMISFMNQINQGSRPGSVSNTREYLDLLKNGIMLKSVELLYDTNKYETIVTNIREVNIVSDFFLPPPNYREAELSDILNLMPEENIGESSR